MTVEFRELYGSYGSTAESATVDARQIAEAVDMQTRERAGSSRPYLMLNMASTADGRARIGGRSGPIGGRADRELFHELRAVVDGVMVGASTLRVERYNRIVDDPQRRARRLQRGLAEEPFACVVSASLELPSDLPLLMDPGARVLLLTGSQATTLEQAVAPVQYVRAGSGGTVDLPAALQQLRREHGIEVLLCEGGPHLNGQLLAAGLVDELHLCYSPRLAGESAAERHLAIVAGVELVPTVELELLSVLESDSYLFLRYRVH